jgi:hypothetical protein
MLLIIIIGDATVNGSVGCELAFFLAVTQQQCEISEAAFILLLSHESTRSPRSRSSVDRPGYCYFKDRFIIYISEAKVHLEKLLFPVFGVYCAVSSLRTKRLLPHIKVRDKNKGYKFISGYNVMIRAALHDNTSQLMALQHFFSAYMTHHNSQDV